MSDSPVLVQRHTPAYWRVTLDNPPLNLFDPELLAGLRDLIDVLEADTDVKVVVFDSANPDYYMSQADLLRVADLDVTPGPTGLARWPDFTQRIARAPFVSIAAIRGRARGAGSEFIQALDLRFASRERTLLCQPEVGAGIIPGGGGMERLWRLTGKARALEILVSSADYDAETAERYGWINRAIPDADLDAFVDRFARRVASFDRAALAAVKDILNHHAGTIDPADLAATEQHFYQLVANPSTQAKIAEFVRQGLQTPGDYLLNLGDNIGAGAS